MIDSFGFPESADLPNYSGVKAELDLLMPVAKTFTLNYYGGTEAGNGEYTITLEVLQDPDEECSMPLLPLSMTISSAENENLFDRCLTVVKAGYIAARGELVLDHQRGDRVSACGCVHKMDVHWFAAVDPVDVLLAD